MIKHVAVFSTLLLATGCLGSNDDTPAYNYLPGVQKLAASPPPYKANILWQAPHEAISADFIEEVGGDTVIAGRVHFENDGFPHYTSYVAYDANSGSVLWEKKRAKHWQSHEVTLSTDIVATIPHLVFRHTRYQFADSQEFLAIDRRTGKEIWQLELDADERAVTAAEAGIIVVSYPAGRIFSHSVVAYSLETGKKVWSRSFADKGVLVDRAPKIDVLGGEVYIQTDEFIRVDPKNGKTIWGARLEFPELDARMESDGVNALVYNDRKYQILDVKSGKQKAIAALDRPIRFVLLTEGRIVLGMDSLPDARYDEEHYQLRGLDAATGKPVWARTLPYEVASNILVDNARLVLATGIRLVGIDLKTGKELFSSARPAEDAPYRWLTRLVRLDDKFLLFGDTFDFETMYFRADNGAKDKRYRDEAEHGTNQPINDVDAGDVAILVSASNAARMAATNFQQNNPPGTTTSYAGPSNSQQAIQRSADVRRDVNSSRMDRQMAITDAYNSVVIDSSFAGAMAMANLYSAAEAVGESIRYSRGLRAAKMDGHKARNGKNIVMRMYRDGRLIVPGWGDPHEGIFVVDFVNQRRAWVAVSPMLDNPNGTPDALKNHFQPYDISSDGKRAYITGYGYDRGKLGATDRIGRVTIPEIAIMAVDLTDLPFTPFGPGGWIEWEPRPSEEGKRRLAKINGDKCKNANSGTLVNADLTTAVEWGYVELLQDCRDKNMFDPAAPAYGWQDRITPLMLAALKGDDQIVDMLLRMGFDPRSRNKDGHTAADYARMGGYPKLAKKLAKLAGG